MARVEDALRDLIQYHGRRAARDVLGDMPDALREVRREVRELRRTVAQLHEDVNTLMAARREEMDVPPAPEEAVETARVTRRTIPSIRKKFDLTQQELAELLEVSAASVGAWEAGRSRPQKSNVARIITLREMDKAEVDEALGRAQAAGEMGPVDVRELRRRFDLTQQELAALVNVSPGSVTNWEAGRTGPTAQNLRALAELGQMEPEEVQQKLDAVQEGQKEEMTVEEIKRLRGELGLSQKELAEKIGVSTGSISNWETGTASPRADSVEKLRALKE